MSNSFSTSSHGAQETSSGLFEKYFCKRFNSPFASFSVGSSLSPVSLSSSSPPQYFCIGTTANDGNLTLPVVSGENGDFRFLFVGVDSSFFLPFRAGVFFVLETDLFSSSSSSSTSSSAASAFRFFSKISSLIRSRNFSHRNCASSVPHVALARSEPFSHKAHAFALFDALLFPFVPLFPDSFRCLEGGVSSSFTEAALDSSVLNAVCMRCKVCGCAASPNAIRSTAS